MGRFIKGRTVRMSRRVPPKNISSVRMETAEAPEAAEGQTEGGATESNPTRDN